MKIGIITIHKSQVNYGASLQSFALWKFISDQGNDCEIIDLLRPCHSDYKVSRSLGENGKSWKQKIIVWVKKSIKKTDLPDWIIERRQKFCDFNKLAKYSREFRSVEDLFKASFDYDVYITGSDQVWNPKMPFINDPYFLTFAPQGKRRVSYASSFGIDSIPQEFKPQYSNWLTQYDQLSTRENRGAYIVEELLGKRPKVVLDPVFLLKSSVWGKYMQKVPGIEPKNYVFVYMLRYDERIINHAIALAEKYQKPLYMVLSEEKAVKHPAVKQLFSIGPSEWLWLVANADLFVTSSFHGTAFSIIFNTPFVVLLQNGVPTNNRIIDLLSSMELIGNQFDINMSSSEWGHLTIPQADCSRNYLEMYRESCDYLIKALS